ncbi:HYR domain-containing protein [Archangium violaceum]|uniref:HYR domain-containing protein n=1 Tax=Archangium violaceum TaxID=83451 RepID=UPI0037BE5BC5
MLACSLARLSGPLSGFGVWLSILTLVGLVSGCGVYDEGRGSRSRGHDAPGLESPPRPRPGTPTPQAPPGVPSSSQRGGFVVVTGDDADDLWHCEERRCGGLFPSLFRAALARSRSGGRGILAIGVNGGQALSAFNGWNDASNGGPGARVTHARTVEAISQVDFNQFAFVYLPSADKHTEGGLSAQQISALNARQPDLAHFINERGGSLIALTQAEVPGGWGFLPLPLDTSDITFDFAEPTAELHEFAPTISSAELSHKSFHNVFTGPSGFSGLRVLAYNNEVYNPHSGRPVMLGGSAVILTAENCADGRDNDGDGAADSADTDCHVCGNGTVDPGEACDDGNPRAGDGCDASCKWENENHAPDATCQDASVCTDLGVCVATVSDLATGSDADGDSLSWSLSPKGPYAPGEYGVRVTASDGRAQDACWSRVKVRDCEAPSLACPADFRVECSGQGLARVNPPEATATDNCGPATVTPPASRALPMGSHTLEYSAVDAAGNTATCAPTVTVVDTLPPEVSLALPASVWPADQRYQTVRLEDCIQVRDVCDGGLTPNGASASISCISSDEARSSSAEPDVLFVDATTVKVRADRSAHGDGRVYSLHFEVRDTAGNVTRGVCPVGVPVASGGAPAQDSGEVWRSCRPDEGAPRWKPISLAP